MVRPFSHATGDVNAATDTDLPSADDPSETLEELEVAGVTLDCRTAGALLAHGLHQSAADVTSPRPAAPRTEPRQFQTYWLPDGRYIEIDAELARGQFIVSFTLETGTVVNAVRMDAPKEGL